MGHEHPQTRATHTHPHGAASHAHPSGVRGFLETVIHPHSHDTADQVDATLEASAEGIRALKISLGVLMLAAVLQAAVVMISGSVALLADTIHNFADAFTSLPLWIAFVLGRRVATRRYTYGYGRAEDLAGVAIVLIILASAILAAWESFLRLLYPEPISNLAVVAAAAVIGFLGNEAAALYRLRVGRRIGSAALIADGYHARTDGLTSLAVLLGVGGAVLGFPMADALVGLGITVMIFLVTKHAAQTMLHRMMDGVEPEVVDAIEDVAAAVDGVQAVSAVRARWLGHRIHAELEIVVNEDLPTWESHRIVERVRRDLFHGNPRLASISVHADPCGHSGTDHHYSTAHHELTGAAPG